MSSKFYSYFIFIFLFPNFCLGKVIKGWDKGIVTMKKGEHALFTIPPKLAYGSSGMPPTIPLNATLQFDVELHSWTNIVDVCKDGGILKQIISQGEKYDKSKDQDEVTGNSSEFKSIFHFFQSYFLGYYY